VYAEEGRKEPCGAEEEEEEEEGERDPRCWFSRLLSFAAAIPARSTMSSDDAVGAELGAASNPKRRQF
jgi:hypothetical protein